MKPNNSPSFNENGTTFDDLNTPSQNQPSSASESTRTSRQSELETNSYADMEKGNESACSSAKQYRKMLEEGSEDPEVRLTFTWEQTPSSLSVTVCFSGLSSDHTNAFDISFTNTSVHIGLSEDKNYDIHFYGVIKKTESRVQLKKSHIILLVVKEHTGLWPHLESIKESDKEGDSVEDDQAQGDNKRVTSLPESSRENIETATEDSTKAATGDSPDAEEDVESESKDKPEEPVHHLNLLKHDFFERDLVFTVQVYIKCLDKDAVKIVFNKEGFTLKFRTGDTKFLGLHEGTSSETTFSWAVTTRQDIHPEMCKFRVKPSGIEVSLHKTSTARWASLEAPVRKENGASTSDTWIPINRQEFSVPSSEGVSTSHGSTTTFGKAQASGTAVAFDEMVDVDLKKDKGLFTSSFGSYSARQEGDMDSMSSFGGSIKIRQDWNKPTAKVQPLNKQLDVPSEVISAGFAGLVNLGNTCFMNCVLQVLANTREFRDYFLDDRFQQEINEDNPLGMKGHLAATFGVLIKRLWSRTKYCWEPRRLKDLISKKNPQFFGYAQHDAHEFLAFLLDGLHEDLNRIRKKPYTETIDSNGRPDEVVAGEAWAQYKQRNDSVVVDLFQGQYKSKLVCPRCGKVSITFDPFLYLSVPLPKKKKVISVTFMWKESYKKPVQYQIVVSQDSTVEKLKDELSKRTDVRTCDIRVFEAHRGRIHKYFLSGATLANVEPKDIIIASEVLSEELAGEEVLEIPVMQRTLLPSDFPSRCAFCHKSCLEGYPLKRCTKCFKVGYCDQTCQRNHWSLHRSHCSTCPEPIGCPFILSLPASRATYGYLIKQMEGFARFSVDVFQPPVKASSSSEPSSTISSSSSSSKPTISAAGATGAAGSSYPASGSGSGSNLSSGLSQSCSSLNSLDSLSSASSTCTLTGDQSDPPTVAESTAGEDGDSAANDGDQYSSPSQCAMRTKSPVQQSQDSVHSTGEVSESCTPSSADSGFDSASNKSLEKSVPMSQVMGVQAAEVERDRAPPTFYIKPVTMEGMGIKGAVRLEDKGETPLELISCQILSMDWRNNDRLPSYVLVQSKELNGEVVDNLNNMATSTGSKPTLYQCLELFTEPEVLSPEEAWYCPSCKKHVEASKQMSIWRLPHTLIIQLKRFSFHNFLMRSKIKKMVEFPTRGLDLSQFCVGLQPGDPPPVYDLYGVANHHGLLIGGHYTSYAKCFGDTGSNSPEVDWRLCDDSRVSGVANEKSVVTADAYLLFYRLRGSPATINTATSSQTNPPRPVGLSTSAASRSNDMLSETPDEHRETSPNEDEEDEDEEASSVRMKEVVNNRLLSELSKSEGSVRGVSHDSLNQSTKTTSLFMQSGDNRESFEEDIYKSQALPEDYAQGDSVTEKQDKEKEVGEEEESKHIGPYLLNRNVNKSDLENDYNEEDDDADDDDGEKPLIIDTAIDLGYTDMEAVD